MIGFLVTTQVSGSPVSTLRCTAPRCESRAVVAIVSSHEDGDWFGHASCDNADHLIVVLSQQATQLKRMRERGEVKE